MTPKTLSPKETQEIIKHDAMLVDIRELDEYQRENIPGAKHIPLARLCDSGTDLRGRQIIFHCKAGSRTRMNAELLSQAAGDHYAILEGGIDAWKAAGLATHLERGKPIEIMRQVQIAAGSLVAIGAGLGFAVHPVFYALSTAVGLGLVFAGISGTCMMAKILRLAPWNRLA